MRYGVCGGEIDSAVEFANPNCACPEILLDAFNGEAWLAMTAKEKICGKVAKLGPGMDRDMGFGKCCCGGDPMWAEVVDTYINQRGPSTPDRFDQGLPDFLRVIKKFGGSMPRIDN